MGNTRILRVLVSVGSLLVVSSAFPPTARAAWVNRAGTSSKSGASSMADCSHRGWHVVVDVTVIPPVSQGGTSLAVV